MANTKNISPDSRVNYLLEVHIANQKKILDELARLDERFDRIEAYVGMNEHKKNKTAELYETQEVMKMLHVSRNTLLSYRKKGILVSSGPGKKILYSIDDINKIKEHKNKTS